MVAFVLSFFDRLRARVCFYLVDTNVEKLFEATSATKYCRGLFHKTYSFIFYGHFAVNYGIFAFMSKFAVKIWP